MKHLLILLFVIVLLLLPGCNPRQVENAGKETGVFDSHDETVNPRASMDLPDIVLITVDALRPDHLGVYGYDRPTSPQIDKLAAEGVVMDLAISQAGYTVPSVASLLSGKLPLFAGEKHQPLPFDQANNSLAEVFQRAGYETAAFIDNGLLNRLSGWDQGFDQYLCLDVDEAKAIHTQAVSFLGQERDRPFFLWLHYLDPHSPYKDRPAYYEMFRENGDTQTWFKSAEVDDDNVKWDSSQARNAMNLYDGEIRYLDDYLGKLFQLLKKRTRRENTLIVLTADHGEAFLEHSHKSHGYDCHDENIRVPLVIVPPSGTTRSHKLGRHEKKLVRVMDLFPTLIDYANVTGVETQGQTLRPLLEGKSFGEKPAISQASSGDFSIRTRGLKVIRRNREGDFVLYDMAKDSGELHPIAWPDIPDGFTKEAGRLKDMLEAYIKAWSVSKSEDLGQELDPLTSEALRSLGYLRD